VRHAIESIDKRQPILRVATMEERVSTSEAARRFAMMLFEAFGIVALVLATVGTYSLLSASVTQRVREIAVRAALGAGRRTLLALVLRQGMMLDDGGNPGRPGHRAHRQPLRRDDAVRRLQAGRCHLHRGGRPAVADMRRRLLDAGLASRTTGSECGAQSRLM
jgi:hypothetical protein